MARPLQPKTRLQLNIFDIIWDVLSAYRLRKYNKNNVQEFCSGHFDLEFVFTCIAMRLLPTKKRNFLRYLELKNNKYCCY